MCEKWGGVGQKVKTFSFKISSQDLMYNLVLIVNNMYGVLEIAKKVDLKSFHHTHTHTHKRKRSPREVGHLLITLKCIILNHFKYVQINK